MKQLYLSRKRRSVIATANFSFPMGNAVRGQGHSSLESVFHLLTLALQKYAKLPTVVTFLSLARLYFDIYTGSSAPSCERLADTCSCIANLSTTWSLKELFLISYRRIKSLARWKADVSHHMTAQRNSSSLVLDIEQERLKNRFRIFNCVNLCTATIHRTTTVQDVPG